MYENFVCLCQEAGISPSRLAKEIGIGPSTITDWKHGRTPRAEKIKAIADYFNVPVSMIMGTDTKKAPTAEAEDALDEQLVVMLKNLSPDKIQRVKDFVSGISST